ncbi:MAG: dTMP kinase [Gammaproteobacteria bacterium]|nr:dTMP kinase [Gammaproteobacteria bacterium]
MSRGRFITIEGVEGAGKSTCIGYIRDTLTHAGKQVIVTREPGGTGLSEEIRDLLLAHRQEGVAVETETLLMFAARAEHLARVIRPALAGGQWVLCDRFTEATYAYQGGGRGLPHERIEILEQWLQGELRPDIVLLLDIPVRLGLERAAQRSARDRFESEDPAFFERVRAAYLDQAHRHPQRFRIIDASGELAQVQHQIKRAMDKLLS